MPVRRRVQVRPRDRAHEQDDRHDHEARRDDGRCEADLALADQDPAAGRDEHQKERSEQLREQPAPFEPRVVPLLARAELELQPVSNSLLRLGGRVGGFRGFGTRLLGHSINLTPGEWGGGVGVQSGATRGLCETQPHWALM